jgi:hypothetical protein
MSDHGGALDRTPAVLRELTELLESLLDGGDDEAVDLLTNEGEALVEKAREILGPGQPPGAQKEE